MGFRFTLTARAENHIRGNPDLADTIARLHAYEEAGADVLYAPGLGSSHDIRAVCEAVSKPVNVLALPHLSLAETFDAGARRVSVGGGLAWMTIEAMVQAANNDRDGGRPLGALLGPPDSRTGSRAEKVRGLGRSMRPWTAASSSCVPVSSPSRARSCP